VPEALLNRAIIAGVAIGAGANNDQDIVIGGSSTLIAQVDMTGAATGDLTVSVLPFEADSTTIMPISMPVVQSVGPTLSAGHVYYYAQFDVTGLDKARLRINNANAGAQTITRASWKLQ
jgi:hypothetical protein